MNDSTDSPSLEASLDDLKVIYRVLTAHHSEHPALARNAFYQSLRRLLEAQATVEGVDVADDHEWEAWLNQVDDAPAPESQRNLLN